MNPGLADLLTCPEDGGALSADDDMLSCENGHTYEVRDGIPRMAPAPEQAAKGGPGASNGDDQAGTFDSFSAKWTGVSESDLEQRFAQQYEWYVQRYGFEDEAGLGRFLDGRSTILEAGTGLGGDSARFARLAPDARVVGIDLSEGIVAAKEHFGGPENLHYVQADIMSLPFAPESFNFVSSDQVIHHTPDAPLAFSNLAALVKPGGHIAVYVYVKKALMREIADIEVRKITTQMSVEECMVFSEQVTELARELSHLDAKVTLDKGVPLLGIEPGEHDVQRLIYWTFFKAFWNDDFSERLNTLVNFDWYHPPYASRHTPEEVSAWVTEAGLTEEHMDVSESGISVLAKRA